MSVDTLIMLTKRMYGIDVVNDKQRGKYVYHAPVGTHMRASIDNEFIYYTEKPVYPLGFLLFHDPGMHQRVVFRRPYENVY